MFCWICKMHLSSKKEFWKLVKTLQSYCPTSTAHREAQYRTERHRLTLWLMCADDTATARRDSNTERHWLTLWLMLCSDDTATARGDSNSGVKGWTDDDRRQSSHISVGSAEDFEWQNEKTYCRYFDGISLCFRTAKSVNRGLTLPPKILPQNNPVRLKNAEFDRSPLTVPRRKSCYTLRDFTQMLHCLRDDAFTL